jgi:hypothetical protein
MRVQARTAMNLQQFEILAVVDAVAFSMQAR